jgi:hypothetical protein
VATESDVAVPGSGTKNVRTIRATTLVDGVATTVEIQVIALADEAGNIISDFMDYVWRADVLAELKRIRRGIGKLTGDPFLNDGD